MADPTIALGSQGTAVSALQTSLNQFEGFDFPVTGVFDQVTRAAVVRFQQMTGLQADGVCGPATWQTLRAAIAQLQGQTPPPVAPSDANVQPNDPNVIQMDPLLIEGQVPREPGSSMFMWLGLAAAGGIAYYMSKRRKERAGPGKPMLAAATEKDEDEPSEDAATWEERARAKRKRMRRSELRFGPEISKRPSGGTVMRNTNRKPTFKVRSEESARQVPYTSKGRSGSHSRGGDSPTDTRQVNEELWLTQRRGSERSTQPYKHRVEESLYNTDPARFRKWAQQKADEEGHTVIVVGQKSARVLYKYSPGDSGPRYSGARKRKLSDAVTDNLLDEPATVASSGSVVDCVKAAHLLTKRKMLARAERERARFNRVVRDVAASCRGEAADAVERVVEIALEDREEAESINAGLRSPTKNQAAEMQLTVMKQILDTVAHSQSEEGEADAVASRRKRGGQGSVAKFTRHRGATGTRFVREEDTKTGRYFYRKRKKPVIRTHQRSLPAPSGEGQPTIESRAWTRTGPRPERTYGPARPHEYRPKYGPHLPPHFKPEGKKTKLKTKRERELERLIKAQRRDKKGN